ncbi:hypothetical protein D9758_010053 [Tetrapyrgos nigripes]|uniref:Uncharacterized protein n=1 Tax=Tetrapyrgos nigripes TaxID=182062 RepID=A0A8H5CVU7_9AGAR|nr:hypothetical protein D9758_010053 [Tetrapyrgos nigripes]
MLSNVIMVLRWYPQPMTSPLSDPILDAGCSSQERFRQWASRHRSQQISVHPAHLHARYSKIWLGRALPEGGELYTLEVSKEHAANVTSYCPILTVGPAHNSMLNMKAEVPYDLISIDVAKYFTETKRLIKSRGVVIRLSIFFPLFALLTVPKIVDNMLFNIPVMSTRFYNHKDIEAVTHRKANCLRHLQRAFITEEMSKVLQENAILADIHLLQNGILDTVCKTSLDNGLPDIAITPAEGKFLQLVAKSIKAKMILEVGTLGGYSTIWLGRALPEDGELLTLEVDENHAKIARENLFLAGLSSKCKVVVGPAHDSMVNMKPEVPFDLILIDADKPSNTKYFKEAKRLVKSGGVIIVDNVVRHGRVADPTLSDPVLEGVRELLEMLKGDQDVEASTIGTVGEKGYDGFLFALRK